MFGGNPLWVGFSSETTRAPTHFLGSPILRQTHVDFGSVPGLKCAPAAGHSADLCSAQCRPHPDDQALFDWGLTGALGSF